MATSTHFYEDTFTNVNDALATYVSDVASNIIGAITPVTTSLLAIYVMLWGWAMMRGMISEPVMDGINRIVRLSLITGVALSVGRYNEYLSDFLWNTPDAMAGYIASGYSDSASNTQYLDSLWSQIYDIGDAFWQKASILNGVFQSIGLMVISILIWASGVAATAYAAYLLVLSKIALAILLGIGPMFVLLIMFEPTKRFFDTWIGQALNYVFLVMLTAASIKLMLAILQKYLVSVTSSGALADPSVSQAFPAIILSLISFLVMMQLPSIASALGGGTAIGTLGSVAWGYAKAKGGLSAMRPTHLRRSYNHARADFRLAAGAVKATAGMPASVFRKLTGGGANRISKG